MNLVERDESELALSAQANLLEVSRSSLYYQKKSRVSGKLSSNAELI